MSLNTAADIVFATPPSHSHFFGYYDKCPLDTDGRRLLAHRTDFDGRAVCADDTAEVGFFDLATGGWHPLARTAAFNWQQGAMLQWLPPDFASKVAFNARRAGRYVAIVFEVATRVEHVLPLPIYAVHPAGEFALAANFARLEFCRPGYRYRGADERRWDCPVHPEDGIFSVDLRDGSVTRIVSTAELAARDPVPGSESRNHWLEHMMWNPAGTRFAFLHRWDDPQAGHVTRLCTGAPDGSALYVFPDSGFYSHMAWRSDAEFVVWGRRLTPAVRRYLASSRGHAPLVEALLPLYRWCRDRVAGGAVLARSLSGQACLLMRDESGEAGVIRAVTEDGHMSFAPGNPDRLLIDTYEDAHARRHLRLCELGPGRVSELGAFPSPWNRTVFRCDLHPRWSRDGRQIVIDSAHAGERRQMYVLEGNW